jgi:hypothetical protein
LIPSIYLSDLKYVIKINSSAETRPKGVKKEKDNYKTENVNVSYGGKLYLSNIMHVLLSLLPKQNVHNVR